MLKWLQLWRWFAGPAQPKATTLPEPEVESEAPRSREPTPNLVRGEWWKNTATDPQYKLPPAPMELLPRLTHKDPTVRRSAAEKLGKLGPEAGEAVPALLQAAADIDGTVRKAAIEALNAIDPSWWTSARAVETAPALVLLLGNRSEAIEQAAFSLLCKMGSLAVPALVAALRDKDKESRQVSAARILGRTGSAAATAVPALAQALASDSSSVRKATAEALGQVGPAAEAALPALTLALNDWNPTVRQAAARSLSALGLAAEPAVPALIQRLPDEVDEVRQAATAALATVGAPAVPALIEILENRDTHRMAERLKERMFFSDWAERFDYQAFQREPLKALHNLRWHFAYAADTRVETVHQAAAAALGKIGPPAEAAVPVLREALKDRDHGVRQAATMALGQLGPAALPALPDLTERLADLSEKVRKAAAPALGQIDPGWASRQEISDAVTTLIRLLGATQEERRLAAAALVTIGPAAVPPLVQMLAVPDRHVREAAAKALGQIGQPAEAAVPALRQTLQDGHADVREAASQALERIAPE